MASKEVQEVKEWVRKSVLVEKSTMDVFEEIVMSYLVRDGQVFVSPQFNLKTIVDGKPRSCCPDFVALNPSRKIVSIIEVSTGANTSGRLKRQIIGAVNGGPF